MIKVKVLFLSYLNDPGIHLYNIVEGEVNIPFYSKMSNYWLFPFDNNNFVSCFQ